MNIRLYEVERNGSKTLVGEYPLADCFPDDPEDCQDVAAEVATHGFAYYGGGAAPLFFFERAQT